ncbi:MAG TPA: alcohol dehydrogenase [Nitrospirae bacterium]|nr:alcohol dehydrogenase [Nitrospirota bacterium]
MKAIVITKPGNVDALEIKEVDEPTPPSGHVKIRTKAFGLNRAETYYRAGAFGEIKEPRIPGIEAVGEVAEDNSGKFRAGQKVITAMGGLMLARHGSYAEYVIAPASNVVAVDTELSWEQLATLPQAYLTIWGALDKNLNIQKGETLLVRGGTTTLGFAAITYAKARGLKVVATTRSKSSVPLLTRQGADEVIIDDGDIAEKVRALFSGGVDCALEIIGAATVKDTLKAVRQWGQVCVVGILSGVVLKNFNFMSDLPNTVRLSFFSSSLFGSPQMPLSESPIQWIAEQVESKKMPSIISKVYEFDQIREAHRVIEDNQAPGKMVVRL